MKFIEHLKIRDKLLLISFIPLAALIYFLADFIITQRSLQNKSVRFMKKFCLPKRYRMWYTSCNRKEAYPSATQLPRAKKDKTSCNFKERQRIRVFLRSTIQVKQGPLKTWLQT